MQRLSNQIAGRGYRRSTLKHIRTYLKAALEYAVDERLINRNPARKLELPKTQKSRERFYSFAEMKQLLSVAAGRENLVVRMLLFCGLRPAELLALRIEDVDADQLRIDEAVKEKERGANRIGETKTETSDAWCPYDPAEPVVCVDEKPVSLHADVRPPIPAKPGKPAKQDNEYERHGTANVFGAVEPKAGRHFTTATPDRSGHQFACLVKRKCGKNPAVRSRQSQEVGIRDLAVTTQEDSGCQSSAQRQIVKPEIVPRQLGDAIEQVQSLAGRYRLWRESGIG